MMKPPTMATGKWQQKAQAPASRVTAGSPVSEADRKVAEAMQRTEQMKPN